MKYVIEYELNEEKVIIPFEGEIRVSLDQTEKEITFFEKYFNYDDSLGLIKLNKEFNTNGKNYNFKLVKDDKEFLLSKIEYVKKARLIISVLDEEIQSEYPFEQALYIQW